MNEALVVSSKKTGLEVNADKTKYMAMFRDQNAGRCHSIKIDNSSVIIIIIFINRKSVDTQWQWSICILHMHGL
jgi:hypothetical protein